MTTAASGKLKVVKRWVKVCKFSMLFQSPYPAMWAGMEFAL